MITYNEFVEMLQDHDDYSDKELALALYCIEEEYGTDSDGNPDYAAALEAEGYYEDDPDSVSLEDAFEEVATRFYVNSEYDSVYECDDMEFYVFDDYDDAEAAAADYVSQLIDDIGIGEMRLWDDYVEEDWFEEAMRESYEAYAEDIESESDDTYGNRLVQECYEADVIDDECFETDEDGNPNYEECILDTDELIDRLATYICEDNMKYYGCASAWYRADFGDDQFSDVVKEYDLVDIDKYAEFCVNVDGVAHFLASYDGNENEFDLNGSTYWIYRCN